MQNSISRTVTSILLLICVCTRISPAAEDPSQNNGALFSSLLKYATLAHAAYQDADYMHQASEQQALIFMGAETLEIEKVAYFIATDPATKSMIIAVRGTSNLENALIDLNYTLQEDNHTGIYLHTGFLQSAANLYREIKPKIGDDYTVHLTGHSLGGAVALILAMHLYVDGYQVGDVVTFGQPKVTNRSGASKFKDLNVVRIVTEHDLVPIVPPFDISDILNTKMDIFWHLGKAYILLPNQYYATFEGLDGLKYGMEFLNKKPSQANIDAHRMDNYLNLIKGKAKRSVRIHYDERESYITAPN